MHLYPHQVGHVEGMVPMLEAPLHSGQLSFCPSHRVMQRMQNAF